MGFTAPIETTRTAQIETNTFVAAAGTDHDRSSFAPRHLDAVDEAIAHRQITSRSVSLRFVDQLAARPDHRSQRELGDELFGDKEFDFRRLEQLVL